MDEVLTTSKLVMYFSKIKFMEQYYIETFNIKIFIYVGETLGSMVWTCYESSPVLAIVKVRSRVYWHKYGDVRFDK